MSCVINPKILNLLCFFGICPYKYNQNTKTIDSTLLRLIYSCVYFLITSVIIDYLTAVSLSKKVINFDIITFEISKIIENVSRSIIHNLCIVDIVFRRSSYLSFLNNLNNFQKNIEADMGFKVNTKSEYFNSLTVISFLACYIIFFSAVLLVRIWDVLLITVIILYVIGSLKYMSYLLIGINICNLNMILLRRYQCIFGIIDTSVNRISSEKEKVHQETFKNLIKCFQKLEELNAIKLQISNVFGFQILLIVSFNFVLLTIALYFTLFPRLHAHNRYWFELFNFVIFNSPSLIILLWMIFIMDKLGNQVSFLLFIHVSAMIVCCFMSKLD